MMRFMPSNWNIKLEISWLSIPVNAYSESLIKINRMGIITGKPKMTISVLALPVFEAIPEIKLSAIEKLIAPSKRVAIKRTISSSGFPKTSA